jgi:hypothetical protein
MQATNERYNQFNKDGNKMDTQQNDNVGGKQQA